MLEEELELGFEPLLSLSADTLFCGGNLATLSFPWGGVPAAGVGLGFPCGSSVDNVVYVTHLGRVPHSLEGF